MKKMMSLYFLAFANLYNRNLNYFQNYSSFILHYYYCFKFFKETYNNSRFEFYASLFIIDSIEIDQDHHKSY